MFDENSQAKISDIQPAGRSAGRQKQPGSRAKRVDNLVTVAERNRSLCRWRLWARRKTGTAASSARFIDWSMAPDEDRSQIRARWLRGGRLFCSPGSDGYYFIDFRPLYIFHKVDVSYKRAITRHFFGRAHRRNVCRIDCCARHHICALNIDRRRSNQSAYVYHAEFNLNVLPSPELKIQEPNNGASKHLMTVEFNGPQVIMSKLM